MEESPTCSKTAVFCAMWQACGDLVSIGAAQEMPSKLRRLVSSADASDSACLRSRQTNGNWEFANYGSLGASRLERFSSLFASTPSYHRSGLVITPMASVSEVLVATTHYKLVSYPANALTPCFSATAGRTSSTTELNVETVYLVLGTRLKPWRISMLRLGSAC